MPEILQLPIVAGFRSIEWVFRAASSVSSSPYTGRSRVTIWPLQVISAVITLPQMLPETAKAWHGFLLACNGREGVFEVGDSWFALQKKPVGFGVAKGQGRVIDSQWPAVSEVELSYGGTVATGASRVTLPAGSWISLGGRLNRLTKDCVTAADGTAKLHLWRSVSLSGEAEIEYLNPKGLFRLDEDLPPFAWGSNRMSPEMSFTIIESN